MPSETRQRFSPCRRLRQRQEFETAFRSRRQANQWVIVYAGKNLKGFSRLGITISKKAVPKATTRNFAKRLIREVFRMEFPVGVPFDVVVRVRQPITPENATAGRHTLQQMMRAIYE